LLSEDWFDSLEAGVRQHIRSFIEAMLESELEAVLNRDRYERAGPPRGIGMVIETARSLAPSIRPPFRCRARGWPRPTARHGSGATKRCPPTSG
jgi:hypothetical protein